MTILEKLKLTTASPREPLTPVSRKRKRLLEKLDKQILAAQAEAREEEFLDEVTRWVRCEDTGDKQPVTMHRPFKKWWWQNQHGAWMLSLRDGNRLIPLVKDKPSVELGELQTLVPTLETLREAIVAGELDAQLEQLIAERKLPVRKKPKQAA